MMRFGGLHASEADHALCRSLIRAGSRSFFVASLVLPGRLRRGAYALYAFCRLSDDLVDIEGGTDDAIARLRRRLGLAYAGRPIDAGVDRAFADVIALTDMPRDLPEALIDGFEWDVRGVVIGNEDDLMAYAARVAGSVGAMMAVLMGVRDPALVARACDLGVAMQLTNIARDVGEDAAQGRLYLPRDWLAEAGIDADRWLAAPAFEEGIRVVLARLLERADALYRRADDGIAALPMACRPSIFAARHIYRQIGVEVARQGFDSVSSRARVSGPGKLRLVGAALADSVRARPSGAPAATLPQTRYLVDSVAVAMRRPARRDQGLGGRIVWAAELLAGLEARQRPIGDRT